MNIYAFIHDFHISSMLVDVNISMPPSDIARVLFSGCKI
jgi:hypothetical protein